MPIRLLQIIPLHDSYRVFLRELTDSLRASGHDVLTLCHMGNGNSVEPIAGQEDNCLDFTIPRGAQPLKHFFAAQSLRQFIAHYRPTHIHAHFSAAILTAALARTPEHKNIQWFGTFQGLQFPYCKGLKGWLTRQAECFAASRLDKVWVLTDDDAKQLRNHAPKANCLRQQSPGFGINDRFLDTPPVSSADRTTLRARLGIPESATVFVFIGRLVQFKGFHLAAHAIFKATQARSDIHWIVIGERDPLHPCGLSDSEWTQFEEHPSIHWLKTQSDVLPWLDASDALLFPTKREGMPVSVMESLARRKPVLTFNIRGCRELIHPPKNGRYFAAETVDAIVDEILRFTPFTFAPPNELRRGHWIQEMHSAYGVEVASS